MRARVWRNSDNVIKGVYVRVPLNMRLPSTRRTIVKAIRLAFPLLLIFAISFTAQAAEVKVAAASDLDFAIKEIIGGFEKATGNNVKLSLGSSGNFLCADFQWGAL